MESAALFNQVKKAAFPLPVYQGKLPQLVEEEAGTLCSPRSINHLQNILKGRYAPALAEFITFLSINEKKIPSGYLPELFNVSLKNESLWHLLKPVIGQKGQWLLQQIPEWAKLVDEVDALNWETGTLVEKEKVLQYWRKHEPKKAITALESIWSQEEVKNKVIFLKTLSQYISINDESFLEERLTDKQKIVRLAAASLLSRIRNSALLNRLFTELLNYLEIREDTIEFELPEELPNLTKDGIYPIPQKGVRGGMKAAWLRQIIAKLPPHKWSELLDKDAEECLCFFEKGKWADQVFPALVEAALWHKNEDWQMALLSHLHQKGNQFDIPALLLKKNIASLSSTVFDELSTTFLENTPRIIEDKSIFYLLLIESHHPWSDKLSLHVVRNFQGWMQNTTDNYLSTSHYRQLFEAAAYATQPHLLEKLKTGWPTRSTVWYYWEDAIEKLVRTIAFRTEMRKELENK